MKVIFTGDNWDLLEGEVVVPRPVRKEVLEEILSRAKKVYMPPSTAKRVSQRILRKYAHKVEILSMRGRFGYYDPSLLAMVVALRKNGLSIRKIAEEVGLPKSTVHYILTKLRKVDAGERIIL